jgi:molybdopterin-guanine dinucleotide biosynthesis protein A
MVSGIVVAGGSGRRLGGVDKALVVVGGVPLLGRALAALSHVCDDIVVVGPARDGFAARFVADPVPGGGPAPAVAAGLIALDDGDTVVVLAVDLPLVTDEHVRLLVARLDDPAVNAAAAADHHGMPNPLLAVYRRGALEATSEAVAHGTAAARLLPAATAIVDLGLAGTLNVNEPRDVERAADALHQTQGRENT